MAWKMSDGWHIGGWKYSCEWWMEEEGNDSDDNEQTVGGWRRRG